MTDIGQNLSQIKERVADAATRSGRRPEDVSLIVVTKTVAADKIVQAIDGGAQHIGESQIQEALHKAEIINDRVKWHLIGHLQRNKVKQALRLFDLLHSVDSLRLAQTIERRAEQLDLNPACLIQVNVAGEDSKHGVAPENLDWFVRQLSGLSRLRVQGLMTIAPYEPDPEAVRPVFRQLRELARQVASLGLPGINMIELSMGMSGDYEVAIEEGSTLVRVGSAIFGQRK